MPDEMKGLNGAAGGVSRRVALAVDPFERALTIGPRIPLGVAAGATILALSLHAGAAAGAVQAAVLHAFGAWAQNVRTSIEARLLQTYEVETVKPPEPEPPKEEPKEEEKPVVKDVPKDQPPPPPPEAAQAAKVLAQDPTPNEPLNFTDGFVQGTGTTYAGGNTANNGTSKSAVYNPLAAATGVPGGTGTGPATAPTAKVDKSRAARLLNIGSLERCPFPAEADAEQIDQATVVIEVKVKPDGNPESVAVTQDPGHGFGREARKCAMRETYVNALDVDGNAIPGVAKIRFKFTR
jgi:protein TonB